MNNELRTINYQLNTSEERQATCDEFAPFWSFYAIFCTFCASLRLKRTVFTRLLKKAISMALWTKAITCDKAGFKSRFCQVHQAGKNILLMILAYLSSRSLLILLSCLISLRVLRGEKIRVISVNPWFIKDLRVCELLYKCRDTFTDVMSALQIHLFMQNKANFQKSQMNVSDLLISEYEQMDTWSSGKNKANTNPIQSQYKPNTKPIQTQYKPKTKPIQTQNKPKTKPIQTQTNPICSELACPAHPERSRRIEPISNGSLTH